MQVRSLGFQTELWFHEWSGQIENHPSYIIVHHPSNPAYMWGNIIFHLKPPEVSDIDAWIQHFQKEFSEFPEVRHVSFSWEVGPHAQDSIEHCKQRGFFFEGSSTCVLSKPMKPKRYNSSVEVKEISSAKEWELVLENQIAARSSHFNEENYRTFFTARWLEYQRLVKLGYGQWFAAYLDGQQVADLGIFKRGSRGRVQRVATLPDFRGKGVAATLLFEAASRAFLKWNLQDLIIVADPEYHALRIYESVGFINIETEYLLYHPTLLSELNRDQIDIPRRIDWKKIPIDDTWSAEFRSFRQSAFRLEVLQAYGEPSEADALDAFLHGRPVPDDYCAEWCALMRSHVAEGRAITRVHVVDLPLSDYMQFEIECAYAKTSKAGENILLLDRAKVNASLGHRITEDFWLFDDTKVMVQDYSSSGRLEQARISLDPMALQNYQSVQRAVLDLAVPFAPFYEKQTGKSL